MWTLKEVTGEVSERGSRRYLPAQKGIKAIKVPELVKKLIQDLQGDGRSDYHVRDMKIRLARFAEAFPGEIGDGIKPSES